MKTTIEFYIPIEKLSRYLKGDIVLYSSIAANGLIKVIEPPENIMYVRRDGNLYYIRKATRKERSTTKRLGKLK